MQIALVWYKDDAKSTTLEHQKNYFLGRLSNSDIEMYKDRVPDPLGIYLYTTTGELLVNSGYRSIVVGRRHALLTPTQDGLIVKDHGKNGNGTLNGTYISEKRIPKGGSSRAHPGDVIRLAVNGPSFFIAKVVDNKIEIPIKSEIPIEIPVGLAKYMKTILNKPIGNTEVTVIQEGVYKISDNIIVRAEKTSDKERLLKFMYSLRGTVSDIIIAYHRGDHEHARKRLELLLNEQYSSWLKQVEGCEGLKSKYTELHHFVSIAESGLDVVRDVIGRLEELSSLVDSCIHIIF